MLWVRGLVPKRMNRNERSKMAHCLVLPTTFHGRRCTSNTLLERRSHLKAISSSFSKQFITPFVLKFLTQFKNIFMCMHQFTSIKGFAFVSCAFCRISKFPSQRLPLIVPQPSGSKPLRRTHVVGTDLTLFGYKYVMAF